MKKLLWYTLNLQLFAGEAAEGGVEQTGVENAVAGQTSAENSEDEFSQLINGKFKEQFTKKTQAIIDKRFKETKELESFKDRVSPIIGKFMDKYGLNPGEEEKLIDYLNDDDLREDTTDIPPENVGKSEEIPRTERLKGRISSWIRESNEIKEMYPEFDLRKEIKGNQLFSQLLLGGAPVKAAYETVHRDEILSGAMAYTAGKVREQVVRGIEAKGRRPVENGVSSESAVVTTVDVNSLTSQDILKILKQVENGASIKF